MQRIKYGFPSTSGAAGAVEEKKESRTTTQPRIHK
jgi:hypothetical protein